MKTTITLLLLATCFTGYSQVTTEIEYNYMKKGYRDMDEKGADVKAGYRLVVEDQQKKSDITVTYITLMRMNNTIAGMIIRTEASYSGTNYYCMPAVNNKDKKSFGWTEFYKDVASMTGGQKTAVMEWIAYRLTYEMSANNKAPVAGN
jgi:hypothetical protein